ncbi:uncharacterized protein LOC111043727 [Nilaparvata lugens]|uniref:uncharacterized protein LOC111043727 n=1 Tax=Nilaparvata lugens TaxID=108931 RepID=UPI00193E9493|nr:uncharacterized protein LOC111043727 [Nilaparvata lugens]
MSLKVWFLFVFIISSSSGSSNEETQKIKEDEPNNNISHHIFICLKVVSRENFNKGMSRFKKVIAEVATNYCRETLVLQIDDLKEENVFFDDISTCSESEKCVTGSLQIKIHIFPFSLNEIHLNDIWNKAKISPVLKQLEIEECKVPTSYNALIITLIVIIVVLGIVLGVLLYLSWDRVLTCFSCTKANSESNKATTDDNSWTYRNNDVYDSAYIQPPGYTASCQDDQSYLEPVQRENNQYITVLSERGGQDNRCYQPDNGLHTDAKQTQRAARTWQGQASAKAHDESDEFDSGEEFSYPSPLVAPPVPPRNENSGDSRGSGSLASQSTVETGVGSSLHYLSSPIQH